jgi:hypothetical protein
MLNVSIIKGIMAARISLVLGVFAIQIVGSSGPDTVRWKSFTSSKYHFSVQYPESWYLSDATTDILDVTNFRRSRPDETITLRVGGAEIQVAGARSDVHTVYDWMHHDLPDDASDAEVHETDVAVPKAMRGGCTKITEMMWRERVAEEAYFAETSYYCQAGSALYKVSLTNWDGDPNQKALRDLAARMVLSLRAPQP